VAHAQPYAAWNKYRTVTVNTAASSGGAGVTQTVSNFPVLVRLSSQSEAQGANILSEALAGGADVRFTDSTGTTALSYQIDHWENGSAHIWVLVPSIAGSTTTNIRLYWGKTGEVSASSGSGVFNGTSGFTGVWHLNEGPGAGTILDATANALNGTRHSEVLSVSGVVGTARYYNAAMTSDAPPTGTESYHVDSLEDNNLYRANGSATRMTISAWVNVRNPGSDVSQGIFGQYRYSGSTGRSSYALMHRSSGSFSVLNTTNGTGDGRRAFTTTDFAQQTWRHVVATIGTSTDGNVVMYVDGVAQALSGNSTQSTFVVPTTTVSRPLIGALERAFNQHFIGYIDELRFSNGTIRDAAWAKLEYETQKLGATAVSLGATVSNQARALFYPTKVAQYTVNTPISANVPTVTGTPSSGAPFTITPALPAGLQFNTTTGAISGTPTALSTAQAYRIVVSLNGPATGADTLQIAVVAGTPPGAPESVTATVSSGQVALTWQAPTLVGSAPISMYQARAVQDTTKTCTWTTGPLTCTVTGLTNGTSYSFVVRAVSTAGQSPFSNPSAVVTPAGVASSPTNVVATQVGVSTSVQVSWTLPTSNGGSPILEYYTNGTPSGLCYSAQPFSGTTATCTVTGLTMGSTYTFTVYAVNSAGNSPNSAASNPVTLSPTSLFPGQYALRANGSGQTFRFTLTPAAMQATEALTMTISDIQGRTVWSQSVNPRQGRIRELTWTATTSSGHAVAPGIYLVRMSALSGSGQTSDFILPATLER
jgi:hypothetical protein